MDTAGSLAKIRKIDPVNNASASPGNLISRGVFQPARQGRPRSREAPRGRCARADSRSETPPLAACVAAEAPHIHAVKDQHRRGAGPRSSPAADPRSRDRESGSLRYTARPRTMAPRWRKVSRQLVLPRSPCNATSTRRPAGARRAPWSAAPRSRRRGAGNDDADPGQVDADLASACALPGPTIRDADVRRPWGTAPLSSSSATPIEPGSTKTTQSKARGSEATNSEGSRDIRGSAPAAGKPSSPHRVPERADDSRASPRGRRLISTHPASLRLQMLRRALLQQKRLRHASPSWARAVNAGVGEPGFGLQQARAIDAGLTQARRRIELIRLGLAVGGEGHAATSAEHPRTCALGSARSEVSRIRDRREPAGELGPVPARLDPQRAPVRPRAAPRRGAARGCARRAPGASGRRPPARWRRSRRDRASKTGVEVAAQRAHVEAGMATPDLGGPAQAGGADDRALRHLVERREARADEGVAGILATMTADSANSSGSSIGTSLSECTARSARRRAARLRAPW